MNAEEVIFKSKSVIRIGFWVALICGMWFDLKSDLRVFKATTELRISQLEKHQERSYLSPQKYALLPNETKIKEE